MHMENKYEILHNDYIIVNRNIKLYRIIALRDISTNSCYIKKGEIGGFVESYDNLSQEGNCWIEKNSYVYENAKVVEDSIIQSSSYVYGFSMIKGSAITNSNIQDCCISDSSVTESKLNDCTITNESEIIKSNIQDCNLYNIVIKEGEFKRNIDYVQIKGLGSRYGNTVFYPNREGEIVVTCGCFFGTLKEFKQRVKCTHVKDETGFNKYREEYLRLIKIMRIHFYGLRS